MQGWILVSFSSTLVQPSIEYLGGLLFKLISIALGGCVLFICREFLSDHRQKIMDDGAASEWISIVSGVPQAVLGPHLCIIYTSEMFEMVQNRLFAYADDSTLLAVFRKSADRPAVAVSLKQGLC